MVNKDNISIEAFKTSLVVKDKGKQRNRKTHLEYALAKTCIPGSVLEFGVFQGTTINIISQYFQDETVWGFDSFEGLPEDWLTTNDRVDWPKGHFKVNNLPIVNNNVKLVKGWFDQTLPLWAANHKQPIKFLHIDCDLYSSAYTVLTLLNEQIVPGTVIVFDELYRWDKPKRYELWAEGEYKALAEWTSKLDRGFEILSINGYMQSAIRMLE
jgi:hypothetical protein